MSPLESQHPAWGHIVGQIIDLETPNVEGDGGPRICPRCLVHMWGWWLGGKAGVAVLVVPEERALIGGWGEVGEKHHGSGCPDPCMVTPGPTQGLLAVPVAHGRLSVLLVPLWDSFSWKCLPLVWYPVSSLTLGQGSLLVVALSPVIFGAWEVIGGAHFVLSAGPGSLLSLLPGQCAHKYMLSTYCVPGMVLGAV